MRATILLLLLLLVAVSAAALWWTASSIEAAPISAHQPQSTSAEVLAADAATHRGDAAAGGAAADEVMLRQAQQQSTARPFPTGATWIEVTVVDRDGSPLGGAEVGWFRDDDRWQQEEREIDVNRILVWRQDPVRAADAIGWQATTGDDGKVRVTLDGQTTVAGRRGRLRGELTLTPGALAPPGGHRLLLDDRDLIEVRVLSQDGQPVPDLPLGLFFDLPGEDGVSYLGAGALAITDEHGGATIAGLAPHRAELADATTDRRMRMALLRPFSPGFAAVAMAIDLHDLPREPVVLRLPPCGTVRTTLQLGSVDAALPQRVTMTNGNDQPFDGWALAPIDEHGVAVFTHVPIGHQLRFSVQHWPALNARHAGPRVAGERVDVAIAIEPRLVVVKARLFDDSGPLADELVQLSLQGEGTSYSRQVSTDAEGRCSVALGLADETGTLSLGPARLTVAVDNQLHGSAALPAQTLRAGSNDLGDLHLVLPELIARGRLVVAGDRAPAAPVRWRDTSILVERFEAQPDAEDEWNFHLWETVDVETGAFELRGEPTAHRLRATPHSPYLQATAPVEFRSGTDDLVLTVQLGLPLAVSILLPQAALTEQLTCRLIAAQPGAADDEHLMTWPQHEQGQRYHLLWGALSAGSYALSIAVMGNEIVRVADVVVPQPAGGDPRLVDIDVGNLLRTASLRVIRPDPNGEGYYFRVSVRDDAGRATAGSYGYDALQLLLPRRPIRAVVLAHGCRPREVTIDGDEIEVRLDGWQPMRVRLADAPPETANMLLQLELHGSDRDQAEPLLQQLGIDGEPHLLSPSFETWHFEAGEAEVRIGDGPHRVRLSATHDHHRFDFTAVTPAVIEPATGTVVLRVPAAEWQRAIQQLHLDK